MLMKIAVVTEWLDTWRGGAETSTRLFLQHLMESGAELHVYTRSAAEESPSPTPTPSAKPKPSEVASSASTSTLASTSRPDTIDGLVIHTVSAEGMSRTGKTAAFARAVESQLQSGGFDIVHAITPCRNANIYQPRGGTVAESVERNIALRESGSAQSLKRYANRFNFKQQYMLQLEREIFSADSPTTVVAISDYVVRQLKNHYALPDARICKIYNGVNGDDTPADVRAENRQAIRAEFGVGDDELLVLSVAHNFRLKGVHRWMEALGLLVGRDTGKVRALVVGRGDAATLARMAGNLRIAKALTFVGASDRVRAFYHAADVMVHPTYYDPCSRVVLEAMVSGLPVITTKWDGSAEMIRDGESGFVLDNPANAEGMAGCVEKLRDKELRQRMGKEAATIAEQVSMARHAGEMMKLYERIAGGEGATR